MEWTAGEAPRRHRAVARNWCLGHAKGLVASLMPERAGSEVQIGVVLGVFATRRSPTWVDLRSWGMSYAVSLAATPSGLRWTRHPRTWSTSRLWSRCCCSTQRSIRESMPRSWRGSRKHACHRRSLGRMKPDESKDLNSGSVGAESSVIASTEHGDQRQPALLGFALGRDAAGSIVGGLAVLLLQWICERGWGPSILAGPIDMTLVFAGTAAFFVMRWIVDASEWAWANLWIALVVAGRSLGFLRDLDPSWVPSFDSADQSLVAVHAATLRSLGVVEPELAAHKATLILMLVREQFWLTCASAASLLVAAMVFAVWSLSRGIRTERAISAAAWSAGMGSVLKEVLPGVFAPAAVAQQNVGPFRIAHEKLSAAAWRCAFVVVHALGFGGLYLLLDVGTSWGWLLVFVAIAGGHHLRWVECACPNCGWAHEARFGEKWTVCEACRTSFLILEAKTRVTSSASS